MIDAIKKALEDLRIPCDIPEVTEGPHVVAYRLDPGYVPYASENTPPKRVLVNSIINRADDIAVALHVPSAYIRYGDGVWLEIPKEHRENVAYNDVLVPDGYQFPVPIGLDTRGESVVIDMASPTSPHLLIAGATGSGKSVCLNATIYGLIDRWDPDRLKLMMIDPKYVELSKFKYLDHLMKPVITDSYTAAVELYELIEEMDKRYIFMESEGFTDIGQSTMGRIVLVVDEFADLVSGRSVLPDLIATLAQKGRAAGIHLILATQRPSVDVIDGVIKANFPTRIAFSVVTNTDSRVILDQSGAERLTGMGDGLLLNAGTLTRFQGIYVSDKQMKPVVTKHSMKKYLAERAPNVTKEKDENGRTIGIRYTPPVQVQVQETRSGGGSSTAWVLLALFILCVMCALITN